MEEPRTFEDLGQHARILQEELADVVRLNSQHAPAPAAMVERLAAQVAELAERLAGMFAPATPACPDLDGPCRFCDDRDVHEGGVCADCFDALADHPDGWSSPLPAQRRIAAAAGCAGWAPSRAPGCDPVDGRACTGCGAFRWEHR